MAVKPGRTGKIRTRSAAKKRIRKTGANNLAIEKVAHNHLLLQKSKRQKAKAGKPIMLKGGDFSRIAKMFGRIKRSAARSIGVEQAEAAVKAPAKAASVAKKPAKAPAKAKKEE